MSASELVDIALANVGMAWAGNSASFAWGISNLAGLPFFDLHDKTDGPVNAPLDTRYASPTWWDSNTPGDGWQTIATHKSAWDLTTILQPGDIVRIEDYDGHHGRYDPGTKAHTFIVVANDHGKIEVVDNFSSDGTIVRHNWSDIVDAMSNCGWFDGVYVSRIKDDFVRDHVPETLAGLSYGSWDGIGPDFDFTGTPQLKIVWAQAGGSFNLTFDVENAGTLAAPAAKAGIYLSTDSTITTADRLVAVDDVAALLAHASRGEGGTFTLPADVPAGNYWIGAVIDHTGAVGELDETNNASAGVRITVFTNGNDKLTVPTGERSWHALGGNDTLTGTASRDALYGDAGNDSLVGGKGNDTLVGGAGHDILVGGSGADYFQFDAAADIGRSSGQRDVIADWDPSADYIDLRKIDANASTSADNKFHFVSAAGTKFSGAKGELRWSEENHTGTAHDVTLVRGDINGDKSADFIIEIKGLHTMHAVDFLL